MTQPPPSYDADSELDDEQTFVGHRPATVSASQSISTRALLEDSALAVRLTLLAGDAGLDRAIQHTRVQKSGLALAGHHHGIVASRIQILGETERTFLEALPPDELQARLSSFFQLGLSCVMLTGRSDGPHGPIDAIKRVANLHDVPLLLSAERSSITITALHALLDERLAPRKRLHGVLIDVFGVGLLLMGPSGIGKSEAALDLVLRGHRLVADDAVECSYRPPDMIFGSPAAVLRYHLEVRGLGILNIKDLFGVTAIRSRKRIDLVARLGEGRNDYDRLGVDQHNYEILGVPIAEVNIPVRPGRDVASILEVAARNELLKSAGHHPARDLIGALDEHAAGRPSATAEIREALVAPSRRVGLGRHAVPGGDSEAPRRGGRG